MEERIKRLEEYLLRVYSKNDASKSTPEFNSDLRSFEEGVDTGESRMAYNVAKIMGFDIEDPEEINFFVEANR